MSDRKIHAIGFTGPIKGGKTFLARELQRNLGFHYISLSDQIRAVVRARGYDENDREILQNMGDELREKYGAGVLAERTFAEIKALGVLFVVIDSIRHPREIDALNNNIPGIIIAGVDASQGVRFQRYNDDRKRNGQEEITLNEFLRLDNREITGERKPHQIQVDKCLALAKPILKNESNNPYLLIAEFDLKVGKVFAERAGIGKERY